MLSKWAFVKNWSKCWEVIINWNQSGPSLEKDFKFTILFMGKVGQEVGKWFFKRHSWSQMCWSNFVNDISPQMASEGTLGFKAPRHLTAEYEDIMGEGKKNKQESLNCIISKACRSRSNLRYNFKNNKHLNLRVIWTSKCREWRYWLYLNLFRDFIPGHEAELLQCT